MVHQFYLVTAEVVLQIAVGNQTVIEHDCIAQVTDTFLLLAVLTDHSLLATAIFTDSPGASLAVEVLVSQLETGESSLTEHALLIVLYSVLLCNIVNV